MRTHLTSPLPQKRPMIVFPVAVVMIVVCGVAATVAPQPGGRHLRSTSQQDAPAEVGSPYGASAPLAQVDVPTAR